MHHKPSGHKLVSRILAGLLVLMFVLTLASQIFLYAFAIDDSYYDRLNELQAQQVELESEQAEYENDLASLSSKKDKLVERVLLSNDKIDNYVSQITNTKAQISFYDDSIAELEDELAKAEDEFEVIRQVCSLRIRSLSHSNNQPSVWKLVFSSEHLSDIYTRIRTLRYLLASDVKILSYLRDLQDELNQKRDDLQAERDAQAAQLEKLNERREKLEKANKDYKKSLEKLSKQMDKYSDRLQALMEERGDLQFQIENEEDIIRTLTEEEEARMMAQAQAELEEAQRRAEEEAAAAEAEEEEEESYEEPEVEETDSEEETQPEEKPVEAPKPVTSAKPSVPTSTAMDLIAYSKQFLGNPYVWGGTSLTKGCDCSGFVMQIYARYGVYLPHHSNSIRECGVGIQVPIAEMIPGDIVCYDGHVGIYLGDNQMINAYSSEKGIIICSIYDSSRHLYCGLRVL